MDISLAVIHISVSLTSVKSLLILHFYLNFYWLLHFLLAFVYNGLTDTISDLVRFLMKSLHPWNVGFSSSKIKVTAAASNNFCTL